MTIYIIDDTGILNGPVELPVIPGLGVQMPSNAMRLAEQLPAPASGHVWVAEDGRARQVADHRGTVYRTDTGEAIQHHELGALPEGLTTDAPATPFDTWDGAKWVTDQAAMARAELEAHRATVAARRYQAETAGIAWQGFGIATDRESQQKMSDERNAVKDGLRADGKGWKCLDLATGVTVFRPTSNAEILDLTATAYRYVSDCFAREEELLAALAAGTYSEDQLEIGWP